MDLNRLSSSLEMGKEKCIELLAFSASWVVGGVARVVDGNAQNGSMNRMVEM